MRLESKFFKSKEVSQMKEKRYFEIGKFLFTLDNGKLTWQVKDNLTLEHVLTRRQLRELKKQICSGDY